MRKTGGGAGGAKTEHLEVASESLQPSESNELGVERAECMGLGGTLQGVLVTAGTEFVRGTEGKQSKETGLEASGQSV